MVKVAVLALADTSSIAMTGLFDVINKADAAYGALQGRPGHNTALSVQLVSIDGLPVTLGGRMAVTADVAAADLEDVELVVVPGLNDDLESSFAVNAAWAPWIAKWHQAGATVASSCSGAFLVAEAGILDGLSATTHWMYADAMQRQYPAVDVEPKRLIIDHGQVITSGGATTFLDLALYLVERFGGRERANAAARVLLIDGARTSQLPYVISSADHRDHDDDIVHHVQTLIDADLSRTLRVETLAEQSATSPRHLARRFRAATGHSPQAYIRLRRVQAASRLLESSDQPISTIARQVGYRDPAAFRRAFRQRFDLTPTEYRTRYGWPTS